MCCRTRCRIASDAGSVCRRPGLCRLSHREPPQRPGTNARRHSTLTSHTRRCVGGPQQMNLESLLRFRAVAVSNTSSLAPLKPRSRRRSSLRMRFICTNLTSTFLRSRHECWKAWVLARVRTCSCPSSSMSRETRDVPGRQPTSVAAGRAYRVLALSYAATSALARAATLGDRRSGLV